MGAKIRPVRIIRGDVDVARDFRVHFLKLVLSLISKPVRARSKNYREPPKEPLRCSGKASADAIASSTLESRGQVQERSPHAHRRYAQQRISQGHVALRGGEISRL